LLSAGRQNRTRDTALRNTSIRYTFNHLQGQHFDKDANERTRLATGGVSSHLKATRHNNQLDNGAGRGCKVLCSRLGTAKRIKSLPRNWKRRMETPPPLCSDRTANSHNLSAFLPSLVAQPNVGSARGQWRNGLWQRQDICAQPRSLPTLARETNQTTPLRVSTGRGATGQQERESLKPFETEKTLGIGSCTPIPSPISASQHLRENQGLLTEQNTTAKIWHYGILHYDKSRPRIVLGIHPAPLLRSSCQRRNTKDTQKL